ncbi:MAG: copper amine oxidase N-terminal domain-containing protein [Clostridia bacterium]|nr:copper amine oxidase N-terminal domain-containing protein [Clostridia bacterium]
MKLKKIIPALVVCAATLISTATGVFARSNVYDVPTLCYQMTIPNAYYAMDEASDIDNGQIAAIVGAPGANFTTLLKNKIMLIDSASYAAQNELLLVIAKSDFTNRVQNFYNKTEEYLNREWFLALGDKKYYDFEFYPTKEALFVHTRSDYNGDMFENYITVKNGLYYMLSARISGNYTAASSVPVLKTIVDSIHFTSHDTIVRLNGVGLDFSQRPMMYKDRTLVPLRTIFEAMGATVNWDDATKTVTAEKDNTKISLTINSNILIKDGTEIPLDVSAVLYNGTTLVPVKAVAESFGATVTWNPDARIVDIKY